MNAQQIEQKLNSIDGLNFVVVEALHAVATPYFSVKGAVFMHGQMYNFETEIDVQQFQSNEQIARLGASLLASVEGAKRKLQPV